MKFKLINQLNQYAIFFALVFSVIAAIVFSPAASAVEVRQQSTFNHMQTGFTLTGEHANLECETCHAGGVFKGTPSACDGCHSPGRRVIATAKPSTHVLTNAPCDTCHTNTNSFLGVRFNHIGVQPRSCSNCHNGVTGPGKPSGHLLTIAQCDSCHRNSAWIPAGFDHLSANPVVTNRCADCHNNATAQGKPANHQVTALQCDSSGCHTNTNYVTFAGLGFDHTTAVPGQCGTCHSGQSAGAPTQPPNHIPYSGLGCDNCHVKPPAATAFNAPMPTMNHSVVVGIMTCSKCHNGSYRNQGTTGALSKADKPGHVATSSECNVCHYNGYVSFAGGVMDHNSISPPVVNRCNDCHLTGAGGAKQEMAISNHLPTGSTQCDACHSGYVSFSQGEKMNHVANGNVSSCKTCHGSPKLYAGNMTTEQLGNHHGSKTTDDCITCHANRFTSWNSP